MKNKILIIILLFVLQDKFIFSQTTEAKYNFIFKETSYYVPMTRHIYDTVITYYQFDVNDSINATQFIVYNSDDSKKIDFISFIFIKQNDTLFHKYYNPLCKDYIQTYLFPINKRDTIKSDGTYLYFIDSIIKNNKYEKILKNYQNNYKNKTYYKKDTLIEFGNKTYDCYLIEQIRKDRRKEVLKKILIDKKMLLPIEEIEYHKYRRSMYKNIPRNNWLLTKRFKLISNRYDKR